MVDEVQDAVDKIAQAQLAADRLEAANKKFEENLAKMEAMATRNILGGKTSVEPVPEKKEESPREYANRMLRGGK